MTTVAVTRLGDILTAVGAPASLAGPILVLGATIAVIWLTTKALRGFTYDEATMAKIPGPPGLPLVGNGWQLAVPHHEVIDVSLYGVNHQFSEACLLLQHSNVLSHFLHIDL